MVLPMTWVCGHPLKNREFQNELWYFIEFFHCGEAISSYSKRERKTIYRSVKTCLYRI